MRHHPSALLLTIVLLSSAAADAVETPPTLSIQEAQRKVFSQIMVDGDPFESTRENTATTPSTFSDHVDEQATGPQGSEASAESSMTARIESFSLRAEGFTAGSAIRGGNAESRVRATADAQFSVAFSVPEDTPYSLSGTISPCDGRANTSVGISGTTAEDALFFETVSCSDETFLITGTVKGGATISFGLSSTAFLQGDDGIDHVGSGVSRFDFVLHFGDRDGDGLLDSWETEGIDFPGAGIEIDLPGLGADPDKKDIFVELDVAAGVPYEPEAIARVIEAFAQAPAFAVDNPDGSAGIQLHVLLDGDRPEMTEVALTGATLPAAYYSEVKDRYFGSESLRVHPQWADIWDLRLRIFRYALWTDRVTVPSSCNPGTTSDISGVAEAIPGNDFIVAAGTLQSWYADPGRAATSDDTINALAGTFMHELGHTLGLTHGGGGQHLPQFKPNYLSIMNYAYQAPWTNVTGDGTNAREAWVLDYSRHALAPLDESVLLERDGVGYHPRRKILFSSAPPGALRSHLNVAWPGTREIDWNAENGIEANAVSSDISRFRVRDSCGDEIPIALEALSSHSDWERLIYDLHTVDKAADREPWPGAQPAQIGIDEHTFLSLAEGDWSDDSGIVLLFVDDFEDRSPEAWSKARP